MYSLIKPAFAFPNEITNNALPSVIRASSPGVGLAFYIVQLWKTMVILGGLAFLIYLIWGGLELMIAGGDKGRLENGTQKITNALIGLLILVGSYAIVLFIQGVFKINLLAPSFSNNLIP
mgnify:CR=1